jgi:hypothetical protein
MATFHQRGTSSKTGLVVSLTENKNQNYFKRIDPFLGLATKS